MARPVTKRINARRSRYPRAIPEVCNNGYMKAHAAFTAGRITKAQAIGMVLTDSDYKAECTLQLRNPRLYAETIVGDLWAAELVANIQREKAQ